MDLPATAREPARTAEVALCVGSRRYQQYFERIGEDARRRAVGVSRSCGTSAKSAGCT